MAAGDVLGSCLFNLFLLGLVDLWLPRQSVFAHAVGGAQQTTDLAVRMLTWVLFSLICAHFQVLPAIGHVSLGSLGIAVLYLHGMRQLHHAERQPSHKEANTTTASLDLPPSVRSAPLTLVFDYLLTSVAIVAAGIWLPVLGVDIAHQMGWTDSMVGTLLVALATSTPEMATCIGAIRIGRIDMILGNLVGSNLFDALILTVDDTVYQAAPLFERLSGAHIVSASMALAMTSITWLAARDNPETRTKWGRWSRPGTALCAGYLIHVGTQLILMQRPPS